MNIPPPPDALIHALLTLVVVAAIVKLTLAYRGLP